MKIPDNLEEYVYFPKRLKGILKRDGIRLIIKYTHQ